MTLTGGVLTAVSLGSYHGTREEYRASRCFLGAHISRRISRSVRTPESLSGLSEWAQPLSGLHLESTYLRASKDEGTSIPVATFRVSECPTGQFPGGTVTLNMSLSANSAAGSVSLHEEANLLIELEAPKTADEINGLYVYPLQNLLW